MPQVTETRTGTRLGEDEFGGSLLNQISQVKAQRKLTAMRPQVQVMKSRKNAVPLRSRKYRAKPDFSANFSLFQSNHGFGRPVKKRFHTKYQMFKA